jgi:hypothetical protein
LTKRGNGANLDAVSSEPLTIVVVGAGPGGTVMVDRLSANAPTGRELEIHVVDPYPPGGGRTWRREQSELMWMNSRASEVSLFTDESVQIEGPIRPGPAIYEWATEHGHDITPATFPPRYVQHAYLSWCFDHIVASAPPAVQVHVHQATAEALTETNGRQLVWLRDRSEPLDADAVLLVQGFLDVAPAGVHQELAEFADAHGLVYLPPHYAADVDLDVIPAGEPVILRGMGLGFVDTMVLLAQGRGGRFEPRAGGGYVYHPSGREPIMYAGSRRGIPYQAKITYSEQGAPLPAPRYLVADATAELHERRGPLDLHRDLWPLIAKELGHFYYHELFMAHPQRVTLPWAEFLERYDPLDWETDERIALAEEAVPKTEDRLDLTRLLSPLEGLSFGDAEDLQRWLRSYITANVERHADPAYSPDLALYNGMLVMLGLILDTVNRGRLSARSQAEDLMQWFQSVFSYYASGPPPQRLLELEALSRAGIVRFLGAGLTVEADPRAGLFRASSPQVTGSIDASALVESRLPSASVARTRDPLLSELYGSGSVTEEVLTGPDGAVYPLGRLRVENGRLVNGSGRPHPRRFALGHWVGRGFAIAGFARPRTNAMPFRIADNLARDILREIS